MLAEWIRVGLAAMTVYRLAQLVTIDEGLLGMFQRLRDWAGTYDRDAHGRTISARGRLFGCPYCIGLYIALAVAALVIWPSWIGDAALLVFGLAGIQAYLQGPRRAA